MSSASAGPTEAPKPGAAWFWVPSLYFTQGLPYVLVMSVSVILYKRLEISNTEIAIYTSWLYLPWVIKPLWSPFIDMFWLKRRWILATQAGMGAAMALLAFSLPMPFFFQASIGLLWLLAFLSATHDIAADGFYMLALPQHTQAAFVGIRSVFWRLAMVVAEGPLVVAAGLLERAYGIREGWAATMGLVGIVFVVVFAYHLYILPTPAADRAARQGDGAPSVGEALRSYWAMLAAFFRKPHIGSAIAFLLLYRLAEAQLTKLIAPFLLDPIEIGGLGLTTEALGFAKGTLGVLALLGGGVLGGWLISRHGLRTWLWPMVVVLNLPDLVFVALAWFQPTNYALVCGGIALEQFGYGFGFTAYTMYLINVADGEYKTAHYALGTGIMALGMMIPGMFAGWIQEQLGYFQFFVWVMICTLPAIAVAATIKIDPGFGRKAA